MPGLHSALIYALFDVLAGISFAEVCSSYSENHWVKVSYTSKDNLQMNVALKPGILLVATIKINAKLCA